MAMNYTTLVADKNTEGSIKYFVRHSQVPSEFVLERAQDAMHSMLRVREMTARTTGTINDGDSTLVLPTDCLEPIALYCGGDYHGRIAILDQEHFEDRVGVESDDTLYEGTPTEATYDGTTLYFNVEADQNYYYRLWYVKKPALLSGANETNFLTTRYGHILEAMCKHYAYAHRENDAQAETWLGRATGYIEKANQEHDMFRQQIQTEMYWSGR
jgi:hypothetical protein